MVFDHPTTNANVYPEADRPYAPEPEVETSAVPQLDKSPPSTDLSSMHSMSPQATIDSPSSSADITPGTKQCLPTIAGSASKLKRSLSVATGRNAGGTKRVIAELDPENQEIVRLFQEENLNWSQIAKNPNERRIAAGKAPTLTDNAIYGLYHRNGPRLAAARGEVWNPNVVIIVSRKKLRWRNPFFALMIARMSCS